MNWNWPFMVRCGIFGILWAIWQAGSSVYVLDAWPSNFTWLRIGSASAVAFVLGCFTYARDPEAAFRSDPAPKVGGFMRVIIPALLALSLVGCASQFGPMAMSPEQIKEWAKVKDLSGYCIKGTYAGANVYASGVNIDKGIPSGMTIKDDCSIVVTPPSPSPDAIRAIKQ